MSIGRQLLLRKDSAMGALRDPTAPSRVKRGLKKEQSVKRRRRGRVHAEEGLAEHQEGGRMTTERREGGLYAVLHDTEWHLAVWDGQCYEVIGTQWQSGDRWEPGWIDEAVFVAPKDLCPTICDPWCSADCHQYHLPRAAREHDPERCPGRRG